MVLDDELDLLGFVAHGQLDRATAVAARVVDQVAQATPHRLATRQQRRSRLAVGLDTASEGPHVLGHRFHQRIHIDPRGLLAAVAGAQELQRVADHPVHFDQVAVDRFARGFVAQPLDPQPDPRNR